MAYSRVYAGYGSYGDIGTDLAKLLGGAAPDIAAQLQPTINSAVESSVANFIKGPIYKSQRNQLIIAMMLQVGVILGGMYLIERYAGRQ